VALAAAHLDHDPTNNRPRNLKALCQRCHMLHDREEHRQRRLLTLRMRNAIGTLRTRAYCLDWQQARPPTTNRHNHCVRL
jgi:hypothetical protein